ncbi:MAG: hypothetical protein IMY67_11180 [Bacteroidetes bacterium]|nr:hypothetical protein [Bacteroidota bacterium]
MATLKRIEALTWWNNLPGADKSEYTRTYLGNKRNYRTVTGREIEFIFKLYNSDFERAWTAFANDMKKALRLDELTNWINNLFK